MKLGVRNEELGMMVEMLKHFFYLNKRNLIKKCCLQHIP